MYMDMISEVHDMQYVYVGRYVLYTMYVGTSLTDKYGKMFSSSKGTNRVEDQNYDM